MQVRVNGEQRDVPESVTVAGLLETLKLEATQVAVEVNQEVVRRVRHAQVHLAPGDDVEIVTFVGGG